MQRILEKQRKVIAPEIKGKDYAAEAWQRFWVMGEELQKRWKAKKSWLEILRKERNG